MMHNFIAYFRKGGGFVKPYWAKWPRKQVALFHGRTVKGAESNMFTYRRSNAHEQCVTRCPVYRLVHSPERPASVICWKIFTRDPGITILWSQLTGLARLSYNRKVDFCCVLLRCRDLCKASQPGSCNQALSSIARFYALPLDLTDFLKPPNTHTKCEPSHNIFLPPSLY